MRVEVSHSVFAVESSFQCVFGVSVPQMPYTVVSVTVMRGALYRH